MSICPIGGADIEADISERSSTRRTLNAKPFEHRCYHGTVIKAARCDFVGGVEVYVPLRITDAQLAHDLFQAGWFHHANIVPELNGFSGNGVEYRIHRQ